MQVHLARYAELLRAYAPRQNLISQKDLDQIEERHIRDSLRLAPLARRAPDGPMIDVGSGAGLPGIPLAAVLPDRRWVLLEPRRKRAAFLEEVVRELDLRVEVICERVEEISSHPTHAAQYALACARALATPPEAIQLLLPLVRPGGIAAIFLGASAEPPTGAEEWEKGIAIVRTQASV